MTDTQTLPFTLTETNLSFKAGGTLVFNEDDTRFKIWMSAWTGIEKIWINDTLVSELRTIGYTPWHRFEHDGHVYEAIMSVETGGAYMATVIRDGRVVIRGKTNPLNSSKPRPLWQVLLSILVLGGAGAAVGYFGVSALISLFS